ncbi:hypothetical protein HD806DRAFT_393883 [Xylariaceae sp. AK1471]|nr:hypothetical protein HD806DRAFT_393883 [Xylariaceae sp. AK1471]
MARPNHSSLKILRGVSSLCQSFCDDASSQLLQALGDSASCKNGMKSISDYKSCLDCLDFFSDDGGSGSATIDSLNQQYEDYTKSCKALGYTFTSPIKTAFDTTFSLSLSIDWGSITASYEPTQSLTSKTLRPNAIFRKTSKKKTSTTSKSSRHTTSSNTPNRNPTTFPTSQTTPKPTSPTSSISQSLSLITGSISELVPTPSSPLKSSTPLLSSASSSQSLFLLESITPLSSSVSSSYFPSLLESITTLSSSPSSSSSPSLSESITPLSSSASSSSSPSLSESITSLPSSASSSYSPSPSSSNKAASGNNPEHLIWILVPIIASVLSILILLLLFWWKRKRKQHKKAAAAATRIEELRLFGDVTRNQSQLYELPVPLAELRGMEQFPELSGGGRQESIKPGNESEEQIDNRIGWI